MTFAGPGITARKHSHDWKTVNPEHASNIEKYSKEYK